MPDCNTYIISIKTLLFWLFKLMLHLNIFLNYNFRVSLSALIRKTNPYIILDRRNYLKNKTLLSLYRFNCRCTVALNRTQQLLFLCTLKAFRAWKVSPLLWQTSRFSLQRALNKDGPRWNKEKSGKMFPWRTWFVWAGAYKLTNMCIFELLRLHVVQSHKISRKRTYKSPSQGQRSGVGSAACFGERYPDFTLIKIAKEDGETTSSFQDSICCTEFIINGGNCDGVHEIHNPKENK